MKNLLKVLLLGSLFVGLINCKTVKKTSSTISLEQKFNKDVKQYFNYLNDENWEEVIAMTNPNLFKLATRESMIQTFSSLRELGISMRVNNPKLLDFGEVLNYKEEQYVKLKYGAIIKVELNEKLSEKYYIFQSVFQKSYPLSTIEYDEESRVFTIDAINYIVAFSNNNKKTWTYFEINNESKSIINQIVPRPIYKIIMKE